MHHQDERNFEMNRINLLSAAMFCIAPLALGASAALAETAPEEIVVTGQWGKVPDSVQSLSQAVSYADLDLSTAAGHKELKHRIDLTARFLCDKLGETDTTIPLVPSCRQAAIKDAMSRVDTLAASAAPRGTTWVRPPAWEAPYPADWSTRYP